MLITTIARRRIGAGALALLALWLLCAPCAADLRQYVARPEPEFAWSKADERPMPATDLPIPTRGPDGQMTMMPWKVPAETVYTLKMRSQVWRDIPWDHSIEVFRPAKVAYPNTMLLFITGGNPGGETSVLGAALAGKMGAPVAVLWNIPNQPLFEGLTEDGLISYTFMEYLKSGDETWPLLFPMAKSAVKAMDALQEFAQKEWGGKVTSFVVTGASKRGWTTWLTGASDRRVIGVMPMVIDMLHLEKQMPHQVATWGKYSEEIGDYSEKGFQSLISTPEGHKLMTMVDPWYYRQQTTMPKLLIHGANDPYWVTDALNIYWDDLVGPKWVLYAPNSGHGLDDRSRVLPTMVAFYQHVAGKKPFPKLSWKHYAVGNNPALRMTSDIKPVAARLWVAKADSLDFRPSKWVQAPMKMKPGGRVCVGVVPKPAKGGLAFYGEAEYKIDGRSLYLSTQVHVVSAKTR